MQKKTVLFFSRCELVHLYGKLDKYLILDFDVIHVAYSQVEADILKNSYAIKNIIIFKNEFLVQKQQLKTGNNFFEELDALFITETDGRFNLNSSLQSDRTFKKMEYEEALHITAVYFNVWKKIFSLKRVDFFIHEPTSLMLNHIASVLCKKQGGIYSTHIMVQGESDFNFIMVDQDNGYPTELRSIYDALIEDDVKNEADRINLFIENFRSSYAVFFDVLGVQKPNLNFYIKLVKSAIKEQLINLVSLKKLNKPDDNIEDFLSENRLNTSRLKNFFNYRKIKYDTYNSDVDFYFYPLHLEPEAVVLYWADGIYTNQVKLIENLAAQLPAGVFLYVKDHPHLYGYRDVSDYKRIQDIPNVKLLPPYLPGKKIVKDSKGVITLNGTAGLEALLLNKQIIIFGSAFYSISERVKYAENIKDFRKIVYELSDVKYDDGYDLNKFVLAYLKSHKIGFTDFYGTVANSIEINMDENIRNVANGLTLFFNKNEC